MYTGNSIERERFLKNCTQEIVWRKNFKKCTQEIAWREKY